MKNDMGVLLLWLGRKLAKNHEALIAKMDAIQNLFETSAEATATPSDILEGKTAYNGTILMTGAMENQGAREATLLAGGTYNIPRGYHDGTGRVTATDLASQTPGTAAAGGILSGLKAWVAGQLINGSMKDRRGVTVTAGAVTQDDEYTYLTIPEEACFNASSKLRTKNSNLQYGLTNLTLVDSFFNNTDGDGGVNDYYFTPPQNGLYTIMAYATGNRSITAVYKNDIDISNTFLRDTGNFGSAFTLLSVNLKTTDRIKIHVENHSVPGTRQYWIYR